MATEHEDQSVGKCKVQGCKSTATLKFVCSIEDCDRAVHYHCYKHLILKKADGTFHPDLDDSDVACTKAHYTAVVKARSSSSKGPRGNWLNDAKDGGPCSMDLVLSWWETPPNFAKFRGKDNDGMKKSEYGNMFAVQMNTLTESTERTGKQVVQRIRDMHDQWNYAHEFAVSETGAGMLATDDEKTFNDIVLKRFPYYFRLRDVMIDRACTEPRFLNTDNDALDRDSSADEGDEEAIAAPEDDDDPEVEAATSVPPTPVAEAAVAPAVRPASAPPTSGRKAKKPKRGATPLMDASTVAMLGEATASSKSRHVEQARHNKRMEEINQQKINVELERMLAVSWKAKDDEMKYKVNMVHRYSELRQAGMDDAAILRFVPALREFIEAKNPPSTDENPSTPAASNDKYIFLVLKTRDRVLKHP